MTGKDLVGLVVVDTAHDAALVGRLSEHQAEALALAVILVADTVVQRQLGALIILAQDEVDDARDRVGAVDRRCTVGQHFDAFDRSGGNRVDVAIGDALAVDQDQRTVGTEAAQRDEAAAGTTAVVDVRVIRITRDRRQLLDQITDGDLARLLDRGAVDADDRVRCFDIDATDIGTRHGDGFQFLTTLVLRVLREGSGAGQADRCRRTGVQRIAHGFEKLVAH